MKPPFEPPHYSQQFSLDRPLPSNEESERAILGAILLDNHLAAGALGQLEPEDFYNPLHRRTFGAIATLQRQAKKIDPIFIAEELKKDGPIEAIGGITTLTNLTYGLPQFTDLHGYIKIVKEKSVARQLIQLNQSMTAALLEEDEEVDTVLATDVAARIAMQGKTAKDVATMASTVDEVHDIFRSWSEGNLDVSGLRTGLPKLDAKLRTRGLAKGEMTLIGARPSTGKTALLIQIAMHVLRLGHGVLFVSLEMVRNRIVMRMLPPITGIHNKAINPHTLKNLPDQASKLHEALDSIRALPMKFDRSFDHHKMIARAEHLILTAGVELVVFDYLQLFKNAKAHRGMSRDQEVGQIIMDLKELAVRTNTASLGAVQLNRESEKEYRRPRMADLRDSGNIEQAADVVLFPWDPYAKEHAKDPDVVKDEIDLNIYCDKQRDGERWWTVKVTFDKNLQTFTELPDAAEIAARNRGLTPEADDDEEA